MNAALRASAALRARARDRSDVTAYLDALSAAFTAAPDPLQPRELEALLELRAEHLGLAPNELDRHLARGLDQRGLLGPDERAEYAAYLGRFFAGVVSPFERGALFAALHELGTAALAALRAETARWSDRTPVFLGTDAEFPKLLLDVDRGGAASRAFYVSRRTLMSEEEARVLFATRRAVCGASGRTRIAADGSETGRSYGWFDNALAPVVMYRLIGEVRAAAERGGWTASAFIDALAARVRTELVEGPVQRELFERDWLPFFGRADDAGRAILRRGIEERRFVRVCASLLRDFRRDAVAANEPLLLVDVAANGVQPLLIAAALRAAGDMAARRQLLGALGERDRAAILDLAAHPPDVAVLLFSSVAPWMRNDATGARVPLSAALAAAVETMKTIVTRYTLSSVADSAPVRAAAPAQQLLAYAKHLVFRNAVLSARGARETRRRSRSRSSSSDRPGG